MKILVEEMMPDFTARPFRLSTSLASNNQGDIDSNAIGLVSMDAFSTIEFVRPQPSEAAAYVDELDLRITRLEAAIAIYKSARIQVAQALTTLEDEQQFASSASDSPTPN